MARIRTPLLPISILLIVGLVTTTRAQQLTLSPVVAEPGEQVTATLQNDTGSAIFYAAACELRVLRHTGELVSPTLIPPQLCDGLAGIPAGGSASFQLTAPYDAGSYTVLFAAGDRAVAQLNVGRPTEPPQQIAIYPTGVSWPQTAHQVDFANPGMTTWEIANTGTQPHTLGSSAHLDLLTPGDTVLVASLSLAGIHVPAGKVTTFTLPIQGLPAGPYSLEAFHDDPVGRIVRTRSGIQEQGSLMELHMTTGRELQPGGSLEMAVALSGFPAPGFGPEPIYALLLGFAPGTTTFGGVQLPLAIDGLAAASLSGLGGLLVDNVGRVPNIYGPGALEFEGAVGGITLNHPNIAGISGLELRMAVLGADATLTTWGASQPEQFTIRE